MPRFAPSFFLFLLVTVGGFVGVSPICVVAQDVLAIGRSRGIQPPAWITQQLRRDPNSFTFRRAWKQKVREIVRQREALRRAGGLQQGPGDQPQLGPTVTGTYAIPVIPALFVGVTAPHTQAQVQERLFGTGSGAVTITDLYTEMSRGLFTFTGTVAPWQQLPNNAAYYEDGTRFGRLWDFLWDSLVRADLVLDFGQFDNDGPDGFPNSGDDDGFVDTAAFIYPTVSQNCLAPGTGIWAHRWSVESARVSYGDGTSVPFATNDPRAGGGFIAVSDYILQSGVNCNATLLMGTGTISHELGHALDLPDLYDTDLTDGDNSEGIGNWGLMGTGSFNTQMSPGHLSAWSKDEFGWVSVTTITESQNILRLSPVQNTGEVFRIDIPGTTEYFLLSNRQALGSDANLPGPGLLVWHIDPTFVALQRLTGKVNALASHKGIDLEEADGFDNLDLLDNRGDAGDPFPGQRGVNYFGPVGNPASGSYIGSYCSVSLANILNAGVDIVLDVNVSVRKALWGDTNGDGMVAVGDETPAYNYALGYRDPAPGPQYVLDGDVDGDGDVDVRDGFLLQNVLAGIDVISRSNLEGAVNCSMDPLPIGPGSAGWDWGSGGF